MNLRSTYRVILTLLIAVLSGYCVNVDAANKKFTVVIDAGHGGKDVGATDNGVMEKNINLQVARELESLIKRKMKDANVVMTRNNDVFLTLQQRADKANNAKGDIFISIHTNSVDKKNTNRKNIAGSAVYTLGLNKDENNLEVAMRENSVIEYEQNYKQKYSGFDPQKDESYIIFEMAQKKNLSRSIQFAEDVEKELVKSGRKDRGVHQAGFWVLWATSMPSVLVELDFICNPESARYMSSDKGAKELAEAIFKALQKYETTWAKTQKETGDSSGKNSSRKLTAVAASSVSEATEAAIEEESLADTGEITTARTRTRRKVDTQISGSTPAESSVGSQTKKSTARRRRSSQSRDLSMQKSYEAGNLVLNGSRVSSVEPTGDEFIASAGLAKTTVKTKEEIRREKEEQKRKREEEKKAKEAEKKIAKQRKKDAHNAKVNKVVTVYKIQILVSNDLLNQGNARFCGLNPISAYKENDVYKYYYGESTNRADMEILLTDVKKKIPDAFIVTSMKTVKK